MCWIWSVKMWFVSQRKNLLWRMICSVGWFVNWWHQANKRNLWKYMLIIKKAISKRPTFLSLIQKRKKMNLVNWEMSFCWKILRNLRNWTLPRLHLSLLFLMSWKLRLLLLWWVFNCWRISVSVHWMMNRSNFQRASRKIVNACLVSPENCSIWLRWKPENCN